MITRKKKRSRLFSFLNWSVYMSGGIVIANMVLAFVDAKGAAALLPVSLGSILIAGITIWYQKTRIYQDILDITSESTLTQHQIMRGFPVPYGLMDEEGRVLWGNEKLNELFAIEKNGGKLLSDLVEEIKRKDFPFTGKRLEKHVRIRDRYYDLIVEKIVLEEGRDLSEELGLVSEEGNIHVLYLFDETEKVLYEREREDEKPVVALIYLDNYDEVLESVEEVRRSLMVALIDRRINRYVSRYEGLMKKLEKDKYLVFLKKKNLNRMKEDRFSILEEIKKVSIGNDMSATVSIGLGVEGKTYSQNYEYARAAIDMALGRGGDQAVLRERENISYYGGKSQSIEKNTRVKARVKAHALRELIDNCDKVFIMGHAIGDMDSFGAAVGVRRICTALGKPAYLVADAISPPIRSMLERIQSQQESEESLWITKEKAISLVDQTSLIVVVDVNRPSHTECPEILDRGADVVVLDHHREMSERIDNAVLAYVEPYASSSCELVAEILQYIEDGLHLSSAEADLMYAGIVVDTNNFINKAGVRTFEAAAFLRRNGADVVRVRKLLRDNMEEYKARAEAVSKAEIFARDFAISECNAEGLASPTVVGAQAANELLNIVGVKASFVLTMYQNVVYVSARSIDEVNVQIIMEKFGGGGHMTIAGAQLKECSVEDAKELLKQTVTTMVEEGEI